MTLTVAGAHRVPCSTKIAASFARDVEGHSSSTIIRIIVDSRSETDVTRLEMDAKATPVLRFNLHFRTVKQNCPRTTFASL